MDFIFGFIVGGVVWTIFDVIIYCAVMIKRNNKEERMMHVDR